MGTKNTVQFDPDSILPIGTPASPNPTGKATLPKEKITFDNAPNDISLSEFFGRIFLGLVMGGCIAALLFAVLGPIGGMLGGEGGAPSGILGILLALVGFIAGMIGNMGLALLYSLFFSKRYYNLKKMCGLIFTSSIIIFIFFLPLYFLYTGLNASFTLLGIQLIFSFYVTSNLIEFLSRPNYSASSLMGNTLGFVISIIAYLAIVGTMEVSQSGMIFMILPTILGYSFTLLGLGLWEAIYYKLFEWGNNPFYLPSLAELSKKRQEELEQEAINQEEVNVEIKEKDSKR